MAFDASEVPWICFVPGRCPGGHHAPPVALALLASGDNSVCGSLFIVPSGMVAAVGGLGGP